MVPLPNTVKAEIGKGGSEKRDYRNPGTGEKMKMREGSTTFFFFSKLPDTVGEF
jgi:hypothetical protein